MSWNPGDVANGHVLGEDGQWRLVEAPTTEWEPGWPGTPVVHEGGWTRKMWLDLLWMGGAAVLALGALWVAGDHLLATGLLMWLAVMVALYFLPTGIAWARKVPNLDGVLLVNLLLGWTFIGWAAALVMACSGPAGTKGTRP